MVYQAQGTDQIRYYDNCRGHDRGVGRPYIWPDAQSSDACSRLMRSNGTITDQNGTFYPGPNITYHTTTFTGHVFPNGTYPSYPSYITIPSCPSSSCPSSSCPACSCPAPPPPAPPAHALPVSAPAPPPPAPPPPAPPARVRPALARPALAQPALARFAPPHLTPPIPLPSRTSSQCSQPSGAPVGPGGGTAKTPGRDGTAKCSPSSSLNSQDGRH